MFVEAHTVGSDDWTTLPGRQRRHTSNDTGISCTDGWTEDLHPFLNHYQTLNADGTCSPTGNIGSPPGEWNAATGPLAPAGRRGRSTSRRTPARRSRSRSRRPTTRRVQGINAFVDDIEVSTGEGTTSFEDDADPLDGWTVSGLARGLARPNPNDWEPHRLGRVRGGRGGRHRRQPLLRLRVRGSEHDGAAQRPARARDRTTCSARRRRRPTDRCARRARPAPRARCGSSSAA